MTTKTQTLAAQQYLDAETAPMLAKMREVLCGRLRAMDVPREVIAATVARVEQPSDAELEAWLLRVADRTLAADNDAITRQVVSAITRQTVTAIYSGDCETAVWLVQFAAAKGEVSVHEMLADFDASAVLARARWVASGSAN